MRARLLLRYAWASPGSLAGLLLAVPALCAGATLRRVDGVLEVAGGRVDRLIAVLPASLRFAAITFGHVVLGTDHTTLACLRRHEHVHVRQYERWGVLFLPLYAASSAIQWLRGRDPYRDNWFEREAFRLDR
ncbi:MAG TPA: hypothetical protein VM051_03960 [Usitatibacter sp.]|nr:hypothetical protein [Usitatibacter sp.]